MNVTMCKLWSGYNSFALNCSLEFKLAVAYRASKVVLWMKWNWSKEQYQCHGGCLASYRHKRKWLSCCVFITYVLIRSREGFWFFEIVLKQALTSYEHNCIAEENSALTVISNHGIKDKHVSRRKFISF